MKQIAAGYGYVLALTSSGNVYSWGYNASGQLGNDTTSNSDTPVEVLSSNGTPLSGITEIAAGTFSMALDQNGNVWTWGANTYGELGNGSTGGEVTEATQLSTISGVRSIAAGNNTAMCITTDGTVEDWGQNNDGQLGDGTTTNSDVPVAPSGVPSQVLQVSSGGGTSYALESDGALYAWGSNQNGQFGNGTTTGSSTPVAAQLGASEVAAGDGPALRVMESGAVDGWGDNTYGELGLGNTSTPETRPVAVGAVATTLSGVALGSDTMSYNGDGLRMKRGSTNFTWDTEGPTPQLLSSGAGGDDFIYGPNGSLLEAVYSDGVPAYYFTDAIGSVRALLGPSGAVTATYNYDPYGALSYESYNGGTRARFAGGYLDTGDGLYYLNHRYYDPATGQFLSVDPALSLTLAPYSYVNGDPVNESDPLGLWGWNPISDVVQAASDVGRAVQHHWRGIAQGTAVVGGALAAAGCIAATAGVCAGVVGTLVTVGGIGGLTGDAVYSVSGQPVTLSGYAESFGLGAIGGVTAAGCGLSVGTVCASVFGASAFNGLVGGILGDAAYASGHCQPALGGFASAFLAGLLQSEPVPIPESWLP